MAKILFINPVIRAEDVPRHVPYGIALLAAICDREGHNVQVLDANAWRPSDPEIDDALSADQWDVIGIGGISTTYGYVKYLLDRIETLPFKPIVILGGGLLTSMPRDIMSLLPRVDVGVVGEAFETLPEILDRLDHGNRNWSEVDGVAWRNEDGKVHLNPPRSLLEDLDSLPYPAWDMFPLEIYFQNSQTLFSEEGMLTQRRLDVNGSYGCSQACRFCFHMGLIGDLLSFHDHRGERDVIFTRERQLRFHSPDYVVNLVIHLKKKYEVDFISFLDENLMTMNRVTGGRWLKEICEKIIEAGLQPAHIREKRVFDGTHDRGDGIHWSGTGHAALADLETLQLMRGAGCSHLVYGLESFNDRVLKNIGKGTTAAQNRRAIGMTLQAGIRPIPNQMLGFPDEWFDSIYDALKAWDEMGIAVKPFFSTPYPGSEWFYTYKERILAQYDNDLDAFLSDLGDATDITAVISENFSAVELVGIRELMVNRNIRKLKAFERDWRKIHGKPKFPIFASSGWHDRLKKFLSGELACLYSPPGTQDES